MNSEAPKTNSAPLGQAEKIYLPRLASALGPNKDSAAVVQQILRLAEQDGADAYRIYRLASQMKANYGPYPWSLVKPEGPDVPDRSRALSGEPYPTTGESPVPPMSQSPLSPSLDGSPLGDAVGRYQPDSLPSNGRGLPGTSDGLLG